MPTYAKAAAYHDKYCHQYSISVRRPENDETNIIRKRASRETNGHEDDQNVY